MNLTGEVAVVTGAAARIGRAIARALGARGAKVLVHYCRSADAAAETVELIAAEGGEAFAVQADLSAGAPAAQAVIEAAQQRWGPPAVLVNNASRFTVSSLDDLDEDEYDRTMSLNLKAPVFLCQALRRRLPPDGRGHVVNLADWRGTRPVPGHLAYTTAKAALVALTRLLAQELAPQIQVNAVAPGAILPPPGKGDDYLESLADRIPLRRTGSVAELVRAVMYLLDAEFVTGEVIHVTGGQQL